VPANETVQTAAMSDPTAPTDRTDLSDLTRRRAWVSGQENQPSTQIASQVRTLFTTLGVFKQQNRLTRSPRLCEKGPVGANNA
jgi:hypothetical protein